MRCELIQLVVARDGMSVGRRQEDFFSIPRERDVLDDLRAPFDPVTDWVARDDGQGYELPEERLLDRLDEVLGPEGWTCQVISRCGRLVVTLSLLLPSGSLSKSGATFHRAAEAFGIGRAEFDPEIEVSGPAPKKSVVSGACQPTSGGALFAWAKESSTAVGIDLVQWLSIWGFRNRCPWSMNQWDVELVADAFAACAAMLGEAGKLPVPPGDAPPPPEIRRGPLDIWEQDPHLELKMRICDLATKLACSSTERAVMETIGAVCGGRRGFVITDLRNFSHKRRLEDALGALEEELAMVKKIQETG